ncbi:MAG: hypothetical protein ABII79_11460 [bacterium]
MKMNQVITENVDLSGSSRADMVDITDLEAHFFGGGSSKLCMCHGLPHNPG